MTQKLTMTIQELADTLGVSPLTIYDRRTKKPDTLPKALDIPGQKTLIWFREDVEKWLLRFRAGGTPPPTIRKGRPPISRRP